MREGSYIRLVHTTDNQWCVLDLKNFKILFCGTEEEADMVMMHTPEPEDDDD